jgi:hypothetical protein
MPEQPKQPEKNPQPSSMDILAQLPKDMRRLLWKDLDAQTALLKGYAKIHDDAAAGKSITADDFNRVEQPFNTATEAINTQLTAALERAVQERMQAAPAGKKEAIRNEIKQTYDAAFSDQSKALGKKAEVLEALAAVLDNAPLDAAFMRDYVEKAAHHENTKIGDGVKDAGGLFGFLLVNNRGVAVGDVNHTRADAARLLTAHMKQFKEAGGDTIYVETYPPEWQALSTDELKTLAKEGYYKDVVLPTPQEIAASFGVDHADDIARERVNMIIAARENGIRVIPIDKTGPVRETEALSHRLASTQFQWSKVIEDDRKERPGGKFAVLAGGGHFIDDKGYHGLVDEALGIPTIVCESDGTVTLPFRKGKDSGGPDFFIETPRTPSTPVSSKER